MRNFTLILVCLLLAAAAEAAATQLVIRLKGGWSIPAGELKEKQLHYEDWSPVYQNSGSYSVAGELSLHLDWCPVDLAFDIGRHLFEDDTFGDIQETTYEHPTGSGRYTDYYHRLHSASLKLELPVALAYRSVTTLGAGFGWYSYSYLNRGDYQPDYDWEPSHSHLGWQLSLTQTFKVYKRIGALFSFEYHSLDLGDDDMVGATAAGAINRISFYCIQLGVSFKVVD